MSLSKLEKMIERRWKDSEYKVVLDKMTLSKSWPEESMPIKEAMWNWMAENELVTLVEEGEDVLDGLEAMLAEENSGVLMDATEVITAIMVEGWKEDDR